MPGLVWRSQKQDATDVHGSIAYMWKDVEHLTIPFGCVVQRCSNMFQQEDRTAGVPTPIREPEKVFTSRSPPPSAGSARGEPMERDH